MTVLTVTSEAKCKHCAYLLAHYKGKKKLHKCNNPESPEYREAKTLDTKVCEKWNLTK